MNRYLVNRKYLYIFIFPIFLFSIGGMSQVDVTPVSERTSQVQNAIVSAADVDSAADVTDSDLSAITRLNLRASGITNLESGDFSGMTGLTSLNLHNNQLSSLPDGIFTGLTALTSLRLGRNTVDPLPIIITLEMVGVDQFKAVAPTGATFEIHLPISVTNGIVIGAATSLSISQGSTESVPLTLSRSADSSDAVTVDLGTLPSLPQNHYGYIISKSDAIPLEVISAATSVQETTDETDTSEPSVSTGTASPDEMDSTNVVEVHENNAPVFSEGDYTIRSIVENTDAATNIGSAISATDADGDTLTYSINDIYAALLDIDDTTGQLITKTLLDFETKQVYTVTVTVSDGSLTDTITVIISVVDVAETVFVSMSIPVSERTSQIRDAIVDALENVDDAVDVTAVHLATITRLDLRGKDITELKSGDFSGLTDLTELNLYGNMLTGLPIGIFGGLTSLANLRLGGNLVDPLPLIVSLQQVTLNQFQAVISTAAPFNLEFSINVTNGSISGNSNKVAIEKGKIYSNTFSVIPTTSSSSPIVGIGGLPVLPLNHFGYILAKSTICNRTPLIAEGIAAVIPGASDCNNISNVDLAKVSSLDLSELEIMSLNSNDLAGLFSLTDLNLSNNLLTDLPNGVFVDLGNLRSLDLSGNTVDPIPIKFSLLRVGENSVKVVVPTAAPFDIVLPLSIVNGSIVNDVSSITIPKSKTESQSFTVNRTADTVGAVTVEFSSIPSLPLGHAGYVLENTNESALVIFSSIELPPVFSEGDNTTRTIAENTETGVDIGIAVSATDDNNDTLTYSLGGTDAAFFAINTSTGQLITKAALDYETKSSYSVTITVSDGELIDNIDVTINVTDIDEVVVDVKTPNTAPEFTDGESTTRSIAENTASGSVVGSPVSATDSDDDLLTYSLSGTDVSSFSVDSSNGQLRTSELLDYETKSSYSVTVSVSDGEGGSDSITVTIDVINVDEKPENNSPEFTDGDEATRTVEENTALGENLGDPFSATDEDDDTLTYSLSGTDAPSFTLDSSDGQLQTSEPLDYERKTSYTLVISVSDGVGGNDNLTVTINITDVDESIANNPPVFTEGEVATRTIAENADAGVNIGGPISATDTDEDTLTYGLSGADSSVFSFDNSSGQLQTNEALDFETKPTYVVTIAVSDGNGGSATITVTINVTDVFELPPNIDPIFIDGNETTRSVEENTVIGTNIGEPISATDVDGDSLIYSLSDADVTTFSIDSETGQLQTNESIDFETQSEYSVVITVSDGNGGSVSIPVTITVTNVNETPEFTDGENASRTIAENSDAGVNIGAPVSATDVDGDELTYSIGGTDAVSFNIDTSTGQLLTLEALDYETKSIYTLSVSVSDDNSTLYSITVTITIIDLEEVLPNTHAPVFNEGSNTSRSIAENTGSNVNIGTSVLATDQDSPSITYQLYGTDASAFSIDGATGQIKTNAALDRETKASYSVMVVASDGELSSTIDVTINITNINEPPFFDDGDSISRNVNENTPAGENIDIPVSATDPDPNTTLVYSMFGNKTDLFEIDANTGQLKTIADLNSEDAEYYFITVEVTDGEFTDSITVRIDVWDINDAPVFTEGDEGATRTIDENTPSGISIGGPVSATDEDIDTFSNQPDTLEYSLDDGVDASAFSIESSTGQIITNTPLDHETQDSYSVTITVKDSAEQSAQPGDPGVLTDTISVTITIGDLNEVPVFDDGEDTERSIDENSPSATAIGTPISATDVDDGDVLTYTMTGTNASSFTIDSGTGQISTNAPLNFEETNTFSVVITVTDNGGPAGPSGGTLTDSIPVTINVNDINDSPVFTEGEDATRNIDENTTSNVNIGGLVGATDEDTDPFDTLFYSLDSSTDASAFTIDSSNGQIKTSSALDHETQDSYSFTVTVSDQRSTALTDTITITVGINDINEAPVFTDNDPASRSIDENTTSNVNFGNVVGATDEDEGADDSTPNTLSYSLSGTDAASFDLDTNNGQLETKADLDFEDKNSYEVTITVSDNQSPALTDSITVNISINDVNDAPFFPSTETGTRIIAENTAAGMAIGASVTATDEDTLPSADTLTYSLGGTDMSTFDIESTTGQINTKDPLNFETKNSYSLTVTVTDNGSDPGLTDTIAVTINITDVNDAPVFSDTDPTTRNIPENTGAGTAIGNVVSANDEDTNPADTLTYSLSGTDVSSFDFETSTGQIKTKDALNFETKSSYSLVVTVSDNQSPALTDTIAVTIEIGDVNESPVFSDTDPTSRNIPENTATGTAIGNVVSANDEDTNPVDTLTYSLSGTDASTFDVDTSSGQIKTKDALNFETKSSYSVIVTVTDNGGTPGLTDTIAVTIEITDVNDAPVFSDTDPTTRNIPENTGAGTAIGNVVSANDEDTNPADTLTYSLSGTDVSSFDFETSTGQIKTKDALNFETRSSYSVIVTVSDNQSPALTDTIAVTININNVNEAPVFQGGAGVTREIAENTAAGVNIGNPITATDEDTTDTLEYTLSNSDAANFDIDMTNGQIKTKEPLNFESTIMYRFTVTVSDGNSGSDSIIVTINVTDLFESTPLADRTAAVKNAIIAASDLIDEVDDVTDANLLLIDSLSIANSSLSMLKNGDFSGLTYLETLNLSNNSLGSLPSDVFDGLSSLEQLYLNSNSLESLPSDIFEELLNIKFLNLSSNSLGSLPSDVFDGLSILETLNLDGNSLSSLPSNVFDGLSFLKYLFLGSNSLSSLHSMLFDGLSSLQTIDLNSNSLSSLPDGVFSDLDALTILKLEGNTTDPLSITVSLKQESEGEFKATVNTGAPTGIVLPVSATNGSITDSEGNAVTTITVPAGKVESDAVLTVTRTIGTTAAVTVDIGTLPANSFGFTGYGLVKSTTGLPLEVIASTGGDAPSNSAQSPNATALFPNFPNPFNPETWIPYQLSKPSTVTLTIYSMRGVVVRELALGHQIAGYYSTRHTAAYWDGRNTLGERVAAGVYIYKFIADDFIAIRKMLILK